MPRYRALATQELPAGVIGARLVQAGDTITVSDDEALLLEAPGAGEWRRLDAPARNRMVATAAVTKSDEPQIIVNGVPLDLDAPPCTGCDDCQCGGE
jgi:hypothetical protein